MTTTAEQVLIPSAARVLAEGYGPGAWHGNDLKAALADVTSAEALWRPATGRHNIAEVALHHAFYQRSVRERLSGQPVEPFVREGEDWFPIALNDAPEWPAIRTIVEDQQRRLVELVDAIESGRSTSPLSASERFDLVLGITCHAIYHAGQVQLIKVLQRNAG